MPKRPAGAADGSVSGAASGAAPRAAAGEPIDERAVRALAEQWYAALDRHAELTEVTRLLVDDGLELRFPEGTFRGHQGFARWYEAVCRRFFDERHSLVGVRCTAAGTGTLVEVRVDWQARRWQPPAARSEWLGFRAHQSWLVARGPDDGAPRIRTYVCHALEPMPGSAAL
ncbi:nuclear transport factor 2 family protein [Kitasatospora sp. LaBMicrA B282]|uniref:nuclear transport factor 2 family protein n=1 Tax=Kitasatospora sp. LaBMicrA B282 TaxID=3420949 RepID=UPI003D10CF32